MVSAISVLIYLKNDDGPAKPNGFSGPTLAAMEDAARGRHLISPFDTTETCGGVSSTLTAVRTGDHSDLF